MYNHSHEMKIAAGPNPPNSPQPDRELPGKGRPSNPVEPLPGQRDRDPGPFIEPMQDPVPPIGSPTDPISQPPQSEK